MWHCVTMDAAEQRRAFKAMSEDIERNHVVHATLPQTGYVGRVPVSMSMVIVRTASVATEHVWYLNDPALDVYRDTGGTRPVASTRETVPPDAFVILEAPWCNEARTRYARP